MSLPCTHLRATLHDSTIHEALPREDVGGVQHPQVASVEGARSALYVVAENRGPEAPAIGSRCEVGDIYSSNTHLISTFDGFAAASSVGASSAPSTSLSPSSYTAPRNASTQPRAFPVSTKSALVSSYPPPPPPPAAAAASQYLHPLCGLDNNCFHPLPLGRETTYGGTGLLSLINPGGTSLVEENYTSHVHQHGLIDELAALASGSMHGCAPRTTAVSFTSDGWNACAPAHSTWQPPVPSHPLSFSYEAGWNTHSGVPHTPDFTGGGGGGVLPYLWSEPCVTHIDPALSPATLSISNICNVVPPRQADGTSSVLGEISAPPVLPSVAVFAGGAQEAFWRRSCLRVTCVPVLRSFDRDDDDGLPEVSSDVPPVVSLGKGEDAIRSSSSSGSGSHITGGARVEGLDELVWRWLDTLGMTDAVEDVVFPGAGRVLVLWTSGLTCEPNSRGCGEGGDSGSSSTPGERLGQLLALRGGGGERRDSAILDAPCEVVFDAMRLLLD